MSKRIPKDIQAFLDIEAEVDKEEDEDEEYEDDSCHDFIDNSEGSDVSKVPPSTSLRSWKDLQLQDDELSEIESYVEHLVARSRLDRHDTTTTALEGVSAGDSSQIYPLYRIACSIGMEEEAVFHLLQASTTKHAIRSAFTRGSIRGFIYVESTLTPAVLQLLRGTPGIIKKRGGEVIRQGIDQADWCSLLMMTSRQSDISEGKWAVVQKGLYKGDIGLVTKCAGWGVELLLIPRLAKLSGPTSTTALKRKKHHLRPEPALFDPHSFQQFFHSRPSDMGGGVYTIDSLTFQNGLVLRRYDYHSIAMGVLSIPSSYFHLFLQTKHPSVIIHPLPRPSEWIFTEKEPIVTKDGLRQGIVKAVGVYLVEMQIPSENNVDIALEWKYVRKKFEVGDYVEVNSGENQGKAGWIQGIVNDTVSVICKESHNSADSSSVQQPIFDMNNFSELCVHINWLKASSPTYLLATESVKKIVPVDTDIVPWRGTEVLVTRKGNPWKGHRGVVKDVLRGQSTPSSLKVQVQISTFNFACLSPLVAFDYNDIVRSSTNLPLATFAPSGRKVERSSFNLEDADATLNTTTTSASSIDSSAAWDPNSRTPLQHSRAPSPSPVADSLVSAPLPSASLRPTHPLLDDRLVGIPLKVAVSGGGYETKELAVTLAKVDGKLIFQHRSFNTIHPIDPTWIKPHHPNATRDTNLLAVIKGEHCGKLVRRFHHRYETKDLVFLQVAVVHHSEGTMDVLTDEHLELEPGCVCQYFESKESRKMNSTLMTALRENARQVRVRVPAK